MATATFAVELDRDPRRDVQSTAPRPPRVRERGALAAAPRRRPARAHGDPAPQGDGRRARAAPPARDVPPLGRQPRRLAARELARGRPARPVVHGGYAYGDPCDET